METIARRASFRSCRKTSTSASRSVSPTLDVLRVLRIVLKVYAERSEASPVEQRCRADDSRVCRITCPFGNGIAAPPEIPRCARHKLNVEHNNSKAPRHSFLLLERIDAAGLQNVRPPFVSGPVCPILHCVPSDAGRRRYKLVEAVVDF